jgi:hypothetical protein
MRGVSERNRRRENQICPTSRLLEPKFGVLGKIGGAVGH